MDLVISSLNPITIQDYGKIKLATCRDYSYIVLEFPGEEMIERQMQINLRLRRIGMSAFLVDIISWEVNNGILICKTMCLSENRSSNNLTQLNCLDRYIELTTWGVQDQVFVQVDALGEDRLLPFTQISSTIEEENNTIIIHDGVLQRFKELKQLNSEQLLKYMSINYKFMQPYQSTIELQEILRPIDGSVLSYGNEYELVKMDDILYVKVNNTGDIRNKVIKSNLQKSEWFIPLGVLLKVLDLRVLSVEVGDKLYLRVQCHLNAIIPVSSVEFQIGLVASDLWYVLGGTTELESVKFKDCSDAALQQLVHCVSKVTELSVSGCEQITDESMQVCTHFELRKLDVSHSGCASVLPSSLEWLSLAYSKFESNMLTQIFKSKRLINLRHLDVSGVADDEVMQVLFTSPFKDLRVLIAEDCILSTRIWSLIAESKYIKTLELLSLKNSVKESQESIFRKNPYQSLGACSCMIQKLDVTGCAISDKLIQSLVEGQRVLCNLRSLNLSYTKVTDQSVQLLCNSQNNVMLRSLYLDGLTHLSEYALEYLSYKMPPSLTELSIAYSLQIKAQDIKKAFESNAFIGLKVLTIQGLNEWGGQAEVFNFALPELTAFFIKTYLPEIQIIQILTTSQDFHRLLHIITHLIQSPLLVKITTSDHLELNDEMIKLLQSDSLLINGKLVPKMIPPQPESDVPVCKFYEGLFNKTCSIKFDNLNINHIHLLRYFENMTVVILNGTNIDEYAIEMLVKLPLQQISLKGCKNLTPRTMRILDVLKNQLISLDIRKTSFEEEYQSLIFLTQYSKLIHFNNGKIKVIISNSDNKRSVHKDLYSLPTLWLRLNIIQRFQLSISARQLATFKFLFNNLSLLLNKNQDQLTQLSINLSSFKQISMKPLQLFYNGLIYLRTLRSLEFTMNNIKLTTLKQDDEEGNRPSLSITVIQSFIMSLQSLEQLRILKIRVTECDLDQNEGESLWDGLKLLNLEELRIECELPYVDDLMDTIGHIETLNSLELILHKSIVKEDTLDMLFTGLKRLNLRSLILQLDDCTRKAYHRTLWGQFVDALHSNYNLSFLKSNFNNSFSLQEIDIHNLLEVLSHLKLQYCSISIIGCLEKYIVVDNKLNYDIFI